ncbi:UDP-N-acetylmuramate dehydrogenase [Nocardioides sp. GY 10127]|uniref:UDP-N-acetylmuramate dehydrogenase n=1 Tax=Nocardioides sp. GY 10127 TaxID=2569762 RepID=UPI0010A7743B|nr:UDP-N-acetylmuramate dehydrogenase [Nocardioides sp. GY 10127]TIC79963.1 UDP-N-acetylmuramate dehydrogenase [Nocardioides sp. GY 10127]
MPDEPTLLADHTTLRLGGPARRFVRATTDEELVAAVTAADDAGEPLLVLGGGSNLVVADAGFEGTVVQVATRGISADVEDGEVTCGGAVVTVAAGEPWDAFVAHAVERGWAGVEALSGIPGSTGATPVQNVGAYGQEVSQTIAQVRTWDRVERRWRTFAGADCGFAYRWSAFKAEPDRYVVVSVTFQLRAASLAGPVAYAELARALGVEQGQRAPIADVRAAVLALRGGKGMVLDPSDHDTWSAGSFFTNPVLDAAQVPDGAPAYPQPDGTVKTSAAWLIDHAGFGKGFAVEGDAGRATLSTKHTLALTNRGSASTEDLLRLARTIRDGVREAYGVELVNEPVLVGCSL